MTQKKFKCLVALLDDTEKKGIFSTILIGDSEKDINEKYKGKYVFIKPPEVVTDESISFFGGSEKLNLKDLLWFFEGLSAYKGISIEKVLEMLSRKTKKKNLLNLLSIMKNKVKSGGRISEVFGSEKYRKLIPKYMIEIIKIGENSSREIETYEMLTEKLRNQQKIRSKTISAMIYPVVVLSIMVIFVLILLYSIIPQMTEIFAGKESKLPPITQNVIELSNFTQNHIVAIIVTIFLSIFGIIFLYKKVYVFKRFVFGILLKIPIIGWVIKKNVELLFLQLFYFGEYAVSSGSATFNYSYLMNMIYEGIDAPLYKEQLAPVSNELKKGEKISDTLEKFVPLLDFDTLSYISFGEESKTLGDKVGLLYRKYTDELFNFYEGISKIIEPLMIILFGIVAGYLVGGVLFGIMTLPSLY